VKTLIGHTDFVKVILLVGKYLFSGSADSHIRQWDIQTGECVRDLKAHSRSVECLAVSEDGRSLFSASSDRSIRKWNIESGQVDKVYEGHETNVFALTVWDDEMWTGTVLN
jgi:WD40 repeat protein